MPRWPRRFRRYRHVPGAIIVLSAVLFLAGWPILPIVMGITGNTKPAYAHHIPSEADAIFITDRHGEMELYPWGFPLSSFPPDAPIMHVGVIREFLVARPALDNPAMFTLNNLKATAVLPMHAIRLPSGRQMRLIPDHPIPPGHYLLLTPPSGMDDGNTWYYFGVTAHGGRT